MKKLKKSVPAVGPVTDSQESPGKIVKILTGLSIRVLKKNTFYSRTGLF